MSPYIQLNHQSSVVMTVIEIALLWEREGKMRTRRTGGAVSVLGAIRPSVPL